MLVLDDVFFSWFWSFIDHTLTLKLHEVSRDEPEEKDGVPSQPWWDYQLHDDGAAVIKIVRRSLRGLHNEAPSPEDEA